VNKPIRKRNVKRPSKVKQTETAAVCGIRMIHQERVQRARRETAEPRDIQRLAAAFQALGDPTRLKMLMAMAGGEMCVCDLAAYLEISDSAVSHQLRRLRDLALVKSRREGQVLYYSLDDDHVEKLLKMGLEHVRE
jgi:ArsR family transcriptional regulator, lead/cadmium/zinc/bismuth-responsive transcriptional repressor